MAEWSGGCMIFNEIATNNLFTEDLTGERNKVQTFLKENPQSVIDIGGAMGSWADEVVTAYLDCNSTKYLSGKTNSLLFDGNISDYEGWMSVLDHVKENGKFDFAICTQTLEDIRNPQLVLKMLPLIAKEGYIDVPSKYHEFRINEKPDDHDRQIWGLRGDIIGYTGHRWILNMVDSVFELYPKLPFVEHLPGLDWLNSDPPEKMMLCFWWKDNIPFRTVNDDFIGPNPPSVYNYYREGLKRGL